MKNQQSDPLSVSLCLFYRRVQNEGTKSRKECIIKNLLIRVPSNSTHLCTSVPSVSNIILSLITRLITDYKSQAKKNP